jgi:hypothetical protein
MLATFHWFQGDGFDKIVEDILALPKDPAVIAEGFRLLPHLVKPLLAVPTHVATPPGAGLPQGRVRKSLVVLCGCCED